MSPIHKSILSIADTDVPVKTLKKFKSSDTETFIQKNGTEDSSFPGKGQQLYSKLHKLHVNFTEVHEDEPKESIIKAPDAANYTTYS